MKQITFILLLSLSFVLGACNAFLDITPQSDYTVEEGYKKESDFSPHDHEDVYFPAIFNPL